MSTKTKGYNLVLLLNGKIVAGTTDNSFSISKAVEESLIKGASGVKQLRAMNDTDASFTISGLTLLNASGEATTHIDYVALRKAADQGTNYSFVYGETGGETIAGELLITNYTENSGSKGTANISITCRVVGSLGYTVFDYYISSTGSDTADGDAPDATWLTIDKLNTEITAGTLDGKSVGFNKGDSWNEAIDFDGHDSITIGAYGTGDLPEITGKKTLTGTWTETSAGSHIWYLTDSSIVGNIRYLYSNGVKMNIAKTSIALADSNGTTTTIVDTTNLSGATDNYNGAELYARPKSWRWDGGSVVTGYNATTHTLTFSPSISYSLLSGQGYFMQNSLDILAANATQGEWIHDKAGNFGTADRIYMYSTSEPSTLLGDIIVSSFETVIKLDNSDHITLKDLKVSHTNGNAITNNANTSNYLTINGLEFEDVICPVWLDYAENTTISDCTIINAGVQGYFLQHANYSTINDNSIKNVGLIKSEGYYNPSSDIKRDTKQSGIFARSSEGCIIKNNNISGIGGSCINAIYANDSIDIKENNLTNYCLIIDDSGAIYIWGSSGAQGNKYIRKNIIIADYTNSKANEGRGTNSGEYLAGWNVAGVYLDDLTDGFRVENNISLKNYINLKIKRDNHLVQNNKTALAAIWSLGDTRWRPAELFREVTTSYGRNSEFLHNEFIGLYDSASGQVEPNQTIYTDDDVVTQASDSFDYNVHQMPFLNKAGYVDDTVQVMGSTNRFQTLDEWKAHTAIVGKHVTGTVMLYSMTGLSNINEMVWYAINPTKSDGVTVTFPSGYRYYTTAGDEILSDTLDAYEGKIYFRTIDEGMPQLSAITVIGTCQQGYPQSAPALSSIYSHEEGNTESGSTYQWYVSDDNTVDGRVAVAGANSSTWTIPSSGYAGKYRILGIVPKAAAGAGSLLTGVERFSEPTLIAS